MSKSKLKRAVEEIAWADKLDQAAAAKAPPPQDPLAAVEAPEPPVEQLPARPPVHVIENMVLRRELYLAKAEIIALKLSQYGIKTES